MAVNLLFNSLANAVGAVPLSEAKNYFNSSNSDEWELC